MKALLTTLLLLFCGCIKTDSTTAAGPSGYHDTVILASTSAYRVIKFPSPYQMHVYYYYLEASLTPGTYSIERATLSKTGDNWIATFSGSDCFADGKTVNMVVSAKSNDSFEYSIPGSPSTTYTLASTFHDLSDIQKYNLVSYTNAKVCHGNN